MSVDTARKLSYQEFLDFEGEDETLWYEWVDGELVVTPAGERPHQLVAARLGHELLRLGDNAGHGLTLPQILFRVSPTRARIPDFVFQASASSQGQRLDRRAGSRDRRSCRRPPPLAIFGRSATSIGPPVSRHTGSWTWTCAP